jgi:hypothetical protein
MRLGLRWTALGLALVLTVPALAADKDVGASAQDYSTLAQMDQIIGKLKTVNPTDKTFTLEIDVSLLQSKNGARPAAYQMEQQERILRQEQEIMRIVNPIQRAQRLQQLAAEIERSRQQQARNQNNVKAVTQHKDFDLESTPDAKVRLQDPPVQYDEKGNVKKYTQQELKELKGDSKLPGYNADWDTLKAGQMIKVTLSHKRDKAGDKNKDNNNKDNKDALDVNKPRGSLILVIKDAPDTDAPAGKKK